MATLAAAATAALLAWASAGCGTDPVAAGGGSIAGNLDGRAFDQVAAAYRIGKPDDPARTIVIHVFDAAVACSEISGPGWDETVADSTQVLELKLIGTAPGTYPIALDGRPSTGESDVNYTVTSTSGTPSEVSASSGTVTLTKLAADGGASGTFDLTFPTGTVSGDFDAASCADGTEP